MVRLTITLLLFVSLFSIPFTAGSAGAGVRLRFVASLTTDAQGNGFTLPEGAACSASQIAVGDTGNGRLVTYAARQGMMQPQAEVRITQLLSPAKLQMGAGGVLFALDAKKHRVVRLNPDGSFAAFATPEGLLAGGFALGGEGALYALDPLKARVLVLDAGGRTLREIAYPSDHGQLIDIAVDSNGTLYALDAVNSMLFSAGKDAKALAPFTQRMKEYLSFPGSLTIDRRGLIYVTDRNAGKVAILDREGTMQSIQLGPGWKDGLLRYPSQICVTDAGDVVIADRENNRVQVFSIIQ